MHVCIFRTDRIGDLVLTLPMAEALKQHDPSVRITLCVQTYTRELAELCPFVDDVIDILGRDVDDTRAFAALLRSLHIDAAVNAYPRPHLSYAAFRARIPRRIGTAYRVYSPLFTSRIREHRRSGTAHEARLNLNLLAPLGVPAGEVPVPRIVPTDVHHAEAAEVLRGLGIDAARPFIVLHPGSGGSAKDWEAANFGLLGRALLRDVPDAAVLVTGTPSEDALMEAVCMHAGPDARKLGASLKLPVLAAVLSRAAFFASNSTGPLHIAAALGVPSLGFYPLEAACHPRRWSPIGARTSVLTPPPDSACHECRSGTCEVHDDMRRITVEAAIDAAQALCREGTEPSPSRYTW